MWIWMRYVDVDKVQAFILHRTSAFHHSFPWGGCGIMRLRKYILHGIIILLFLIALNVGFPNIYQTFGKRVPLGITTLKIHDNFINL